MFHKSFKMYFPPQLVVHSKHSDGLRHQLQSSLQHTIVDKTVHAAFLFLIPFVFCASKHLCHPPPPHPTSYTDKILEKNFPTGENLL